MDLRDTPRWRPLVDFVTRWYARPLEPADGCSAGEVAAAEARLGRPLPAALREWYLLVGRRLEDVLDPPARLEALGLLGDQLDVWYESDAVWVVRVRADGPDDPPVVLDHDATYTETQPYTGRLVETLLGLVTSETLVGAWAGEGRGLLGALHEGVRGGYQQSVDVASVAPHYPVLPSLGSPFFVKPERRARGDAETIVRFDGVGLGWATATPEALERLSRRLPVQAMPPAELVVRFAGARPDPYGVIAALGPTVKTAQLGKDRWTVVLATRDPRGLFERLRAGLPPGAEAHLAAGFRPPTTARYTPLWPPGMTSFRP